MTLLTREDLERWKQAAAKARASIPNVYFPHEQPGMLALIDSLDNLVATIEENQNRMPGWEMPEWQEKELIETLKAIQEDRPKPDA
jgi:hypothetical protein